MSLLNVFIEVEHLKEVKDAEKIKQGLLNLNGVYRVAVDVPNSVVKIAYFNSLNLNIIKFKLNSLGYPESSSAVASNHSS